MSPGRPSRGPHSTHRREPARPAGRGGPRGDPSRRVDPARRAAYDALAAVHRDDAYANIVLPRLLRENRITGRDAALATELTYGTLRSLGQLDAILVTAAAGYIPPVLLSQLKPGGRMVIPVGSVYGVQNLILVEQDTAGEPRTRNLLPVRFVPMLSGLR